MMGFSHKYPGRRHNPNRMMLGCYPTVPEERPESTQERDNGLKNKKILWAFCHLVIGHVVNRHLLFKKRCLPLPPAVASSAQTHRR